MDDTLGGGLPNLDGLFYLFIAVCILGIGFAIYAAVQESQTVYEMPNGVMCDLQVMRGGGILSGSSTFEFRRCDDGEIYINPEHFEEIRK